MDLESIGEVAANLRRQVQRVVVGQEEAMDLLLVALLAEGHVLLQGVPGTGKTLLVRTFASCLSLEFKRIQFTPDLMPADVLGTNLFDFQTGKFVLRKGPVFTQLLMADEINRTPPKTQAALLEAMQERSATLDGESHDLGAGFMVIATQNPIEHEGTYPLPEAQLDRFLFLVKMEYPSRDQERQMVQLHGRHSAMPRLEEFQLESVADLTTLLEARRAVAGLLLPDEVVDYIIDLVRATREDPALLFGASPRAANMMAVAARATAALDGRDYVLPDDVKRLAPALLGHRVGLAPGAELEGLDVETIVGRIVEQVAAPRSVRPTLRCALLAASGVPVALLPALLGEGWWTAWAAAATLFVIAVGTDLILCPTADRLRIRSRWPDSIPIGRADTLWLAIGFEPLARAVGVEVLIDLDDRFVSAPRSRTRIAPGHTAELEFELRPRERGELELACLWLRWSGPLGLMRRTHRIDLHGRVAVVPDVQAVREAALLFLDRSNVLSGLKVERFLGDGTEFDSLRDFVPGFDHRSIDWKASARNRKLLAREYRAERNHQVIVAFDTGHLMAEPLDGVSRLDRAVTGGLLLAYVGLKSGDAVGLTSFDAEQRTDLAPQRGVGSFARFQRATARLRWHATETNFTLGLLTLSQRLRRRSLIVLLTDFQDSVTAELMVDDLGRMARRHVVLCVTLRDVLLDRVAQSEPRQLDGLARAVVAGDMIREREMVLRRLTRRGVHCMDTDWSKLSMAMVSRYLDIKRRELV